MNKKYTKEQEDDIAAMYATKSIIEIADKYGVPKHCIYTLAKRLKKQGRIAVVEKVKKPKPPKVKEHLIKHERKMTKTRGAIKDRNKAGEVIAIKKDAKTTVYVTIERAREVYGYVG